ncbi:MAG: hypothetical protein EXR78_01670 [Deltaproteobacteria bacterium]|nr:hypothetical protein [Deltaproteobacteria bacterium]
MGHGRKKKQAVLVRFIQMTAAVLMVCGVWVQPGQASWFGDSWSRFDRFLATFDPAGRYVRQPVEKQVPALTFKGFYRQWTDVMLTGEGRVGNRKKDFRFAQLQNLFELEMHYQFSPNLELTSVNHFLYDGVYNWQDSAGLYAPRINETSRKYHNFDRIVRELYLSYRTHSLDVVIGKQQIAWGKMDGQFIDIINPMDRREAVQLEASDFEYRRIPTWMANVTYFFGANSLNLLYIPNFEQNRQAVPGSPWFSPSVPPSDLIRKANVPLLKLARHRKRPSFADWGDHEYGARLDVSMEPLTWGLIYFYAWNDDPTSFIIGRHVANDQVVLDRLTRHTRLHHFGITADYATAFSGVPVVGELPVVMRVEGLWTKGVKFSDTQRVASAATGELNSGLITRDTMRAALAIEFAFPGNTSVILQPSLFFTFDWRESLGNGFGGGVGDQWSVIPVFFVGRPFRFTRDRLRLELTVAPYLSGPVREWQGLKTKVVASYNFSQFITGRLIYTAYSSGGRRDIYGQYDHWDNIGWEISYEF